jgi:hypothetical protein
MTAVYVLALRIARVGLSLALCWHLWSPLDPSRSTPALRLLGACFAFDAAWMVHTIVAGGLMAAYFATTSGIWWMTLDAVTLLATYYWLRSPVRMSPKVSPRADVFGVPIKE